MYFITIVTQNRKCNLSKITLKPGRGYPPKPEMELSDFGKIVEMEWYKSFEIRNEFIIMPNHLHAIVEICNTDEFENESHPASFSPSTPPPQPFPSNDTNNFEILPIKRNPPVRLPKSISSFIGGFKSAVNSKIDDFIDAKNLPIPKYNRNNHFFQPNYHDHIIRNQVEYSNIKNYIINNPLNWYKDTSKE